MTKYLTQCFFLLLCVTQLGCDSEDEESINWFCGEDTGLFVENELGKIYQLDWYGEKYYYIGDLNSEGGGHIPCGGLSEYKTLAQHGGIVTYSGHLKEPVTVTPDGDPFDPIYGGIELTSLMLTDMREK